MSAGYAQGIGRVICLLTVVTILWRSGAVLPAPPVHSVGALEAWWTDAGADVVLVTVVRLAAILVASSLLVLTTLRVAALAVVDATRGCLDHTMPGVLLGLARGLASLSLTAGVTSAPPPVSHGSTEDELDATPAHAEEPSTPGTATMRPVEERWAKGPGSDPAPAGLVVSPPPAPRLADSVVVAHGDSLWSIAEEVVTDRGGSTDEGSIARYWRVLIAANLHNLVDPGNADLIHPGQRLILPPG